jgi:hypothetical protein
LGRFVSAALVNLGLTATAAELNILDGATVTTAEVNALDGVTATGTALIVAADAAAGRVAIAAPAVPITGAGVGRWQAITSSIGGTLTLPAGGVWAYSAYRLSGTGNVISSTFNVDNGGTVVGASAAGELWSGFAWRVS